MPRKSEAFSAVSVDLDGAAFSLRITFVPGELTMIESEAV